MKTSIRSKLKRDRKLSKKTRKQMLKVIPADYQIPDPVIIEIFRKKEEPKA